MTEPVFAAGAGLVAVAAGGVASVAGFGIGSMLTPLLAVQLGTRVAVAAVSVPHAVATALRFWMMREHLDRRVLWSFGLMSAAGGLTGALLHSLAANRALTIVFGCLLIFAGVMGLTSLTKRLRFHGVVAWVAGAMSGLFGGLVGNQGGIRSAALLAFDLPRDAFVATATAIGLVVDAARMPVYLTTEHAAIWRAWLPIAAATVGVVVGTLAGRRVLERVPEHIFRAVVSTIILTLGAYMLARA